MTKIFHKLTDICLAGNGDPPPKGKPPGGDDLGVPGDTPVPDAA